MRILQDYYVPNVRCTDVGRKHHACGETFTGVTRSERQGFRDSQYPSFFAPVQQLLLHPIRIVNTIGYQRVVCLQLGCDVRDGFRFYTVVHFSVLFVAVLQASCVRSRRCRNGVIDTNKGVNGQRFRFVGETSQAA